ncbi:MAG: MBL fold metallo-hydrolase [Methanothrix sp.]|nr:MBL fold metallo-hydrolase [Methanothrix sp.]
MIVTWLGHSCFLLKSEDGLSLLLDPFHESDVGYSMPITEADVVIISHDHMDHNNVDAAGSKAEVIFGPGDYISLGMDIIGVKSYHDAQRGKLRGTNTIFCFALDGIRVCHLGDLGHTLTPSQVKAIGPVDLLFVPVGGRYTIDAAGANKVMGQLHPVLTVPMHYRTGALNFELDPVDDFLKGKGPVKPQKNLKLAKEDLSGEGRVVLLTCPGAEGASDR